jgi:hypothetical protein
MQYFAVTEHTIRCMCLHRGQSAINIEEALEKDRGKRRERDEHNACVRDIHGEKMRGNDTLRSDDVLPSQLFVQTEQHSGINRAD